MVIGERSGPRQRHHPSALIIGVSSGAAAAIALGGQSAVSSTYVCLGARSATEVAVSLFHGIQLQHLVQPSLAVLFIECVDDAPHDTNPPVHPMKAMAPMSHDHFVTPVFGFAYWPSQLLHR